MSKGELGEKVEISRARQNVAGNCWWPGYSVTRKGSQSSLFPPKAVRRHTGRRSSGGRWCRCREGRDLQKDIALVPPSSWLSSTPPAAPAKVSVEPGGVIAWQAPAPQGKIGDSFHSTSQRVYAKKLLCGQVPSKAVEAGSQSSLMAGTGASGQDWRCDTLRDIPLRLSRKHRCKRRLECFRCTLPEIPRHCMPAL